jgi:hypothetical protein
MSKTYQWFVVRGRVSIWRESSIIILELDPEGSPYSVLSAQDALEIAEIITEEARVIWDRSEKRLTEPARIEGDIQKSCKLWADSATLQVVAHDSQPLVALSLDSGSRCELDISCAVALVQILQSMVQSMERK